MSRDSPSPQKEEEDDGYDAPRPMPWTIKFDSLSGLHQPPIDGPLWCEPSYDAQSISTLEASVHGMALKECHPCRVSA